MELTVLIDNNTFIDRYFLGEPAVSYYIKDGSTQILFDVGYSDAFLINARKMHIPLLQTDYVVLSHGHNDHTGGLDTLTRLFTEAKDEGISCHRPELVAHPKVFLSRVMNQTSFFSCTVSQEALSYNFNLKTSAVPVWLTKQLVFLGEIPRTNAFENKQSLGDIKMDANFKPDYVLDDTALVYNGKDGLVIITACSHSGICNIIEYAKKVCGQEKIIDIIGGFHLMKPNQQQLQGTLDYFQTLQPTQVHASHCVDLPSKIALSKVVNIQEVGVGLTLRYN